MKNILDLARKNILLAPYTSIKIGGKADYLFSAGTSDEIVEAVAAAKERSLPYIIMGMGSNMIISDKGFRGLVILNKSVDVDITGNTVVADSGVLLARLINDTVDKSLAGLEPFAGIPGTVGGAVYGNAGTKDYWMDQILNWVLFLNTDHGEVEKKDAKDIRFSYRFSEFKDNKYPILKASFSLKQGDKEELLSKINEQIKNRKRKQPTEYPNSGSVFKNPSGRSVGELIDKCGLKGYVIGKARWSEVHTNFIENVGGARSDDAIELIEIAKERVKEKFGITLELENILIGK